MNYKCTGKPVHRNPHRVETGQPQVLMLRFQGLANVVGDSDGGVDAGPRRLDHHWWWQAQTLDTLTSMPKRAWFPAALGD
jgi:hypothetical protein